ncbi:DNA adenine methylase [Roseofilum casamattae]|uniref:site-specific DNA-methyltransferase (adenine-specific) n=1 Tax=Roseofilum casamattae BLCC-M143 TaxID=3022442 RepID=A0ABT7BVY7_9CYAN|nr:DNA adenine methylase [Roseofilum casamattae]MDJ1183348.1 DNA adenine methylase [Roseofilum casamattae BLCC-M143]
MNIKSPLRYPGGKSRAIQQIIQHFPSDFSEYREPFVGGGSLFIYLKQQYPELSIWINDLNPELYFFWHVAQTNLSTLVADIWYMKKTCLDGKVLFTQLTQIETTQLSDLERAARFFVLNRITFSGTVESGGFSQEAFEKRFTDSSISRLENLSSILNNVKITNLDYSEIIAAPGENPLIFCDPPYVSATSSKLYGKDGNLHTNFDHDRFARVMEKCPYQWLITYDNCSKVRENFDFARQIPWELQYGMNNYKKKSAAKGKELFIVNYKSGN